MPGHAALFALPFTAFLAVASPLTGRELGLQCAEFVQLFFRGFPKPCTAPLTTKPKTRSNAGLQGVRAAEPCGAAGGGG